jgi:hypothetical protein
VIRLVGFVCGFLLIDLGGLVSLGSGYLWAGSSFEGWRELGKGV